MNMTLQLMLNACIRRNSNLCFNNMKMTSSLLQFKQIDEVFQRESTCHSLEADPIKRFPVY